MAQSQQVLRIARRQDTNVPLILRHPEAAERAAKDFLSNFQGEVMYAVKSNPDPHLLATLWRSGIRSFDVASLQEVREVRFLIPTAKLNFMNPVKNEYAIREAYMIHDVRMFSLDTEDELKKIMRATEVNGVKARDLTLCARIGVESKHSMLSLAGKFGVVGEEGEQLLRAIRDEDQSLGICFHVGSQCMDPEDYENGLIKAHEMAQNAGVRVDVVIPGGGLPVEYPGMKPPPLSQFLKHISQAASRLPLFRSAKIWLEPGRALSAPYHSVVMRVELVKADCVFTNNGLWGDLHDAARNSWPFEMVLLRSPPSEKELKCFSLAGPTCDSEDFWPNACRLPSDIAMGDLIWVKNIGAYGVALRTQFNGFNVGINEVEVVEWPEGGMLWAL